VGKDLTLAVNSPPHPSSSNSGKSSLRAWRVNSVGSLPVVLSESSKTWVKVRRTPQNRQMNEAISFIFIWIYALFLALKASRMHFSPISVFLGLANLVYTGLNFQLLRGLRNLSLAHFSTDAGLQAEDKPLSLPKVTVLIAARNEALRISKCLDSLLVQDFDTTRLQIIIVDDRSDDGTADLLREYANRWPGRLTLVSVTKTFPNFSPKKYALSQGMKVASGDIILTTDADCIMSKSWVSSVVAEFGPKTGLVLGMTSYYPMGKPGIVWGTEALEFISYGIVAAGLVGLRFPVHGNANNIAYRREVYLEAAGFATHSNIISGDDDFLIQSINKLGHWEIRYSVLAESQVQTEPPLSLGQFWEQRKRWASKCSLYEPKQTAFLIAIFSYYSLIPLCILLGFFDQQLLYLGLISWAIKTGTDYIVMREGLRLFSKQSLMRWFPTTCLMHIPLIIAAVIAGTFGGFTWKDQRVKRKL
jgi:cellulose synthase/poly-beta-1,6-N-acetylglucosamine synthase-like glycosyltransferase